MDASTASDLGRFSDVCGASHPASLAADVDDIVSMSLPNAKIFQETLPARRSSSGLTTITFENRQSEPELPRPNVWCGRNATTPDRRPVLRRNGRYHQQATRLSTAISISGDIRRYWPAAYPPSVHRWLGSGSPCTRRPAPGCPTGRRQNLATDGATNAERTRYGRL